MSTQAFHQKRAQESMEMEGEKLGKDQVLVLPGSAAVLTLFSSSPLDTGSLQLQSRSWRKDLRKKSQCRALYFV